MLNTKKSQFIAFFIVIGIFLLCYISSLAMTSDPRAKLDTILEQYNVYVNKKTLLQAALAKGTNDNIAKISGLSDVRKNSDDKEASKFFELLTTWSSKKQYDEVRSKIMLRYGIKEDSEFLTGYMPAIVELSDVSGKGKTNFIDAYKSAMSYKKMQSYVTKISGDKYDYFTFVTTSGINSFGSSVDGDQLFTYTMDSSQKISNIRAYGLTSISK